MGNRLVYQQFGLGARPIDAENRDECRLSRGSIRPDRLPGLRRGALDIEEIVGDLEGEAQIMGIAAQRNPQLARRLGENRPASHANAISAPVFIRCRRVIAPISRR